MSPQFSALRDALESERAELAESTTAADPELVAVFDLAGSVDGFLRAAREVDGLEFLADLQEDVVEPDDDFYFEDRGDVSDDGVPQSLYMIMTNAQAVAELVRLFDLWREDPQITFERGLNPLKEVFALLRAIRRWGPADRIRETGLLEQWQEDVEVAGAQGSSRVEIELWYRDLPEARREAQARVVAAVQAAGGNVLVARDLPDIAYHALLADIPMSAVERVLAEGPDAIELLKTETIMLVSPNIPMTFHAGEPETALGVELDASIPEGPPRIALIDGAPLANHVALAGRLIVDDADDRESNYGAAQRVHGTAMASLIAHGDLATGGAGIKQPIYVRPVLEPHPIFDQVEVVPPDELLVDLIQRSFHRIFEGDGNLEPAAPSVRIVNLSIGDPARTFVRRLSPLARLIDWLAHRYNILIVVSAGNHPASVPAVDSAVLADPDKAAATAARSLRERTRQRRLLSPAEAINCVTVGALHQDGSDRDLPASVLDIVPDGTPASYSACGFGFRRSVKPEMLLPGGRQVFLAPTPDASGVVNLAPASGVATGPGLAVAAPGLAGELDAIAYTCGTSNAAALATRYANEVFDVLEGLTTGTGEFPFPDPQYHPVLARTLLVHATGWHDLRPEMERLLGLSPQEARRELTRLMGYGPLRPQRLAAADRVRVVLLGAGSITRDKRHTFRMPLPEVLRASKEWRRLTVTLSWFSPVSIRSQKYRVARLRFVDPRDQIGVSPLEADHNAMLKGTVQHQVFEGEAAVAFVEDQQLAIDVDCRVDAGRLPAPVRYGIAASLEVGTAVQVDVHEQVRQRLLQQVREQARGQVRTS